MELPQSRSYGAAPQGGKATHDFLSLYTHSSLHQDPRPSHGDFLKTHNFLQPLEGEQKNGAREDTSVDMNAKPQPVVPPTSVVEHILPGGFGTYTITNLPSFTPKPLKTEENVLPVASATSNDRNDDNSNCSSYTGSGFTLWDESATRKGNAGKENLGDVNAVKDPMTRVGQWPLDWPSQSSSNHRSSVSPLSSSQALGHKSQSFMEMLKSAKGPHPMEEEDEEDLSIKKESSSSQRGELRVKVDGKNSDQKANTPRSKHSATEQRRRCKINDRFSMLRELIPHSDQKRDKASFLLEVIEYIQFLQEKVNRYEGPHPVWTGDPAKLIPWGNSHGRTDNLADQPRVANGVANPLLMFGAKLDEKPSIIPLNIPRNPQTQAECGVTNSISFKAVDQHPGLVTKPGSISQLQTDIYTPIRSSVAVAQLPTRIAADVGNASLPQLQLWQSRTPECQPAASTAAKLKEPELSLDGGTINISSIYSQGLLSTLTKALQNSGVDLSQASISVQVDIGKRANNRQSGPDPKSEIKNAEVPCSSQSLLRGRVESTSYESDHAIKRLKTG